MCLIIKGDFVYSRSQTQLETVKDGYLVCKDGICQGIFSALPESYRGFPVQDYSGKLVFPGLVDLHIHAPQYAFRGLHMDEELMDWLKKYTFPEESKYADPDYARLAYRQFARQMRRSATTRLCAFSTVHRSGTLILMEEMEQTGLISYIGKINMDRDAPLAVLDASPELSAYNTFGWINETQGRFQRTFPILTPRFIPSCSDKLLEELREIVHTYDIPVQSHLSENLGEIELVRQLMPDSAFYGEAYDRYDLFGRPNKTIMAHCVHSSPEEVALMRQNGVYVAHCPSCNINISSGIAPIRRYLEQGLPVGLGSDVAGGESESLFNQMKFAIDSSKLYALFVDQTARPLTFPEVFWLATVSGGSFFGQVGSFAPGYEADIVVLDDSREPHPQELTIAQRLERCVYLGSDKDGIVAKYVAGRQVL